MNELKYIEVSLVEHCNLNCAGCSHFSPLAKEEYIDKDVLSHDLKRLAELFKGNIRRIRLMGGEPLLHNEIAEILGKVRGILRNSEIQLVTNGLLLDQMDHSFYKSCVDNDIEIHITKYPIRFNYYGVEKAIIEKGIKLSYAFESVIKEKTFHYLVIDHHGNHDAEKNFYKLCTCSECTNLKSGKLYLCPVRASIRHFCNYFGRFWDISPDDGLDIFDDRLSSDDVFSFLSKPCDFCKYCDCESITYGHKWRVSGKSLNEWT